MNTRNVEFGAETYLFACHEDDCGRYFTAPPTTLRCVHCSGDRIERTSASGNVTPIRGKTRVFGPRGWEFRNLASRT